MRRDCLYTVVLIELDPDLVLDRIMLAARVPHLAHFFSLVEVYLVKDFLLGSDSMTRWYAHAPASQQMKVDSLGDEHP